MIPKNAFKYFVFYLCNNFYNNKNNNERFQDPVLLLEIPMGTR
jgi:hypothetical protein